MNRTLLVTLFDLIRFRVIMYHKKVIIILSQISVINTKVNKKRTENPVWPQRAVPCHIITIQNAAMEYTFMQNIRKVICGTPCVVQTEEQTEDIDTPLGIKPTYPRFATHSIYQRTRLVSVAGETLAAHTGLTLLPTLLP